MLYRKTPSSLSFLNKLQMSYREAFKFFKKLCLELKENVIDNNDITDFPNLKQKNILVMIILHIQYYCKGLMKNIHKKDRGKMSAL